MKLSTKVRYGTRAMLDLASTHGNGPVLLKDIAKRQEISLKYLDRILSSLKTAGLVRALRGSKGGYSLTKEPSQITLKQILEALEGPLELVECINHHDSCRRVNFCVTHDVWSEIEKTMEARLDATTLEALVIKDADKKNHVVEMYHI